MSVQTRIEIIRKANEMFVAMINNLSVEELNAIPDGFNNNIIWNFAHSLAVQQAFFYALSKLPYTIDEAFINQYKKGTRPERKVEENEIADIIRMFAESINGFENDYKKGIFQTYQNYTTSIGFTLTNIDEAIQAASFHDGWHFGYARAIKKMVEKKELA